MELQDGATSPLHVVLAGVATYLLRPDMIAFLAYIAAAKSLKNLTTSGSELLSDKSRADCLM